MKAYTIGRTSVYDELLSTKPVVFKLGKQEACEDYPQGYEGGITFSSFKEANYFKINNLSMLDVSWDPITFSVYEIELISDWETDTYVKNDFYSCLINDAKIIKKVKE